MFETLVADSVLKDTAVGQKLNELAVKYAIHQVDDFSLLEFHEANPTGSVIANVPESDFATFRGSTCAEGVVG